MRRSIPLLIVLAIAAAVALQALLALQWWHPYCDNPTDSPSYWAIGFPFPNAELSGGSSEQYVVLMPLYLLDLVILAVPIFAILRLIWRRFSRPAQMLLAVTLVGSGALTWFGSFSEHVPVFATSFGPYDSLIDYRPASAIDVSRHRSCEF
jgi:hypothetical protein